MRDSRVFLNARFTGTRQPTGTQTAAYHLFDAIIRQNRDLELVVFADSRFLNCREWKAYDRVVFVETPFQDWTRSKAQLWEQLRLPIECARHHCCLAHHPMTTNPVWKNGCKSIVTLHDFNFYLHPEWYRPLFRLFYRITAIPGLRHADAAVTISDYIKEQAARHLHIPPNRLSRIYNGVIVLRNVRNVRNAEFEFAPPSSVSAPPTSKTHSHHLRPSTSANNFPDLILRRRPTASKFPSISTQTPPCAPASALGILTIKNSPNNMPKPPYFAIPPRRRFDYLLEAMAAGTPWLHPLSCLPETQACRYLSRSQLLDIASGLQKALTSPLLEQLIQQGIHRAQEFIWKTPPTPTSNSITKLTDFSTSQ